MTEFLREQSGKLTSFQIIILGFAGVILAGALLLMLPVSSAAGQATPFMEALFTSTSAVCVTGLVVHDTATYWSGFGQLVLLLLIQIGGMGVITVAVSFVMLSGRKITLMQRSTMQEAISAPKMGGIVRLTGFIVKTTLVIELLGAAAMARVFCRDFGLLPGMKMALFHSISSFCNAGFDLMGVVEPYSSLTAYAGNWVINLSVMLLIVTGGIGFLTWDDIRTNGIHLRSYRLQSKVILAVTAALIAGPALFFYLYEFGGRDGAERILCSLFAAVTPRTAGYNTVPLSELDGPGQALTITLMLIGGAPGSTAGGMKVTTVAVMFTTALAVFRRQESARLFGRSVAADSAKHASAIFLMYVTLFLGGAFVISVAEGLPMGICLFETASAIGTVGLSLGATPELGNVSRCVLVGLMFFGRVGGLTLIFAAMSGTRRTVAKLPTEKIMVG